jgi:hypothetical protein
MPISGQTLNNFQNKYHYQYKRGTLLLEKGYKSEECCWREIFIELSMAVFYNLGAGVAVSIVSGYGLDDRAIEVRSATETRDFSSNLCFQTDSEAHTASCPAVSGGPFPGGKAQPGRDADLTPI